ncbi:NADH-quinone oxidoreductase subunit NuoH [uncultured Propionibacterium sp.]|uniref:NADH-quinone oxidoreductase subunit NuoH n=1 Tax=uncultured Propionibacterium sp. TaxID=218066 RepID=UPI0029308FAC|nr:NADH-quinone oxidoreductase subunit NuoH [uncultured Propionibacterium sp.]
MNPLESAIFGPDPWWLVVIKVIGVFVVLLLWTIFNVWFERRVLGRMQNRKGPIMNGPLGLPQAMGDGVKLLLKEDFRPARTDRVVFSLAPMLIAIAAFSSWAVIPLGGEVRMFGRITRLQVSDLPVSVLLVLAIASVGVYGVVLAGWASNGTYSFLGSMRATAQLISYEVCMGLSLVAVFMYAGSMSTSQIVEAQMRHLNLFGLETFFPTHYWLPLLPSFCIYIVSIFGETNRLPFDLAECESEIVSGHITDYSGFRYAMFFLAEYINVATVSGVCTTLFLGGYGAPWPFSMIDAVNHGWWGLLWFFLKAQLVVFFFVWVRAALPRFRYDQFMDLGWKWLIPISLAWILVFSILRGGMVNGWFASPLVAVLVGVAVIVLLAWALWPSGEGTGAEADAAGAEFDAFAGGYPVPPMPGRQTRQFAGIVAESEPPGTPAGSAGPGSDGQPTTEEH